MVDPASVTGFTTTSSDEELLPAARAGDHHAWSLLCRRHAASLAAYLGARLRRPAVVDQLVGETIVAAWAHVGECADAAAFPGFLRRAGATAAMRWAKDHPDEPIDEPFPVERLPAAAAADAGAIKRLHAAMAGLNEAQRMAVELHWRGGLSDEALAVALRLSPADARTLLQGAETELTRRAQ